MDARKQKSGFLASFGGIKSTLIASKFEFLKTNSFGRGRRDEAEPTTQT
jgi:hypothetical protein